MANFARLISNALTIAISIHGETNDELGKPYLLHLLRVMNKFTDDDNCQLTALLHDVMKCSSMSLDDLRAFGFPQDVLNALYALYKREGDDTLSYLIRVANDPIAKQVKLCELEDRINTIEKIPGFTEQVDACHRCKEILLRKKIERTPSEENNFRIFSTFDDDLDVYRD